MSNSHAQHGVVVPAWDTVAVKATLKPSMGVAPKGKQKEPQGSFFITPSEAITKQWSHEAWIKLNLLMLLKLGIVQAS